MLVQSRNDRQMFESCWATFRLGRIWVLINFRLRPPEVAYRGAYRGAASGAVVMIAETACTSGTTGRPKAAVLTHGQISS